MKTPGNMYKQEYVCKYTYRYRYMCVYTHTHVCVYIIYVDISTYVLKDDLIKSKSLYKRLVFLKHY